MSHAGQVHQQPSQRFAHLLEHLAHILPGQAPLRDFVHHNTLHGFQHLPFPQALKQMHEITGAYGYWPVARFREQFLHGRIDAADLDAVLQADAGLDASAVIFTHAEGVVTRGDVYRAALIHPIKAISPSQFVWQVEENRVLERFGELWAGCLEALSLQHYLLHSEELMTFSPERAVRLFAAELAQTAEISMEERLVQDAQRLLLDWVGQVGTHYTVRSLLLAVTGEDIMHSVRPLLLRQMGAWLDQGLAAWTNAERAPRLFAAWREASLNDLTPLLEDLPDWREHLASLPDEPAAVIVAELQRLGIPEAYWDGYLECLALEMPGWSGMFLWREQHPGYGGERAAAVDMLDYLALRLVLEHLFARRLCRRIWWMEANVDVIRGRFRRHWAEFLVRYYTFQQPLPEYLLTPAQQLIRHTRPRVYEDQQWEQLAHQMWTWAQVGNGSVGAAYHHGWRLFRLMQHLKVDAATVRTLSHEQLASIFACLDAMDEERAGFLWLQAYERHYREQIFNAVVNNHGRGMWRNREQRPQAQLVFCMDEREEGIRRHLEELNPVTRHHLLLGTLSQMLLAPASLGIMLGKSYLPLGFGQWVKGLRRKVDKPIPTTLEYIALQSNTERSSAQNQMGFTDAEQADKVGGFLRMIGLTDGFAPLVVIMGHGSTSQNNPHAAAYECGACSGRHSGPNARVFAAMANRAQVRELLAAKGLVIPADTWFVGAEHDTCDEHIPWFDTHKIPAAWQQPLRQLQALLEEASRHSAHERCRKLASAPRKPSLQQAAAHIASRAVDYSQARPELGHATNAWALIGRRAVTRGSFLDRRCFLISYDCTRDPDGKILENILLSAGPVGAGINLEYYFSTVNNERYGAGTKVTHNLTGLFGVMEGVFSDLRTGLPQQMIEIHEPMRLLVVVEAKTALVGEIYARQPPLQELIGGGWLLLAVKDPDSAAIDWFVPGTGFVRWEGELHELPLVDRSAQWYLGDYGHLSPALVTANAVSPHPLTPSPSRGEGGQEGRMRNV